MSSGNLTRDSVMTINDNCHVCEGAAPITLLWILVISSKLQPPNVLENVKFDREGGPVIDNLGFVNPEITLVSTLSFLCFFDSDIVF
jgi:hypothetical protein